MFGSARGLARLARSGSALSDRGRGTAAPADASGVLLPPRRRSLLGEGDASTPPLRRAASFSSGSPSSSSSATTWRKQTIPTTCQPQCPAEAPPITQMKIFISLSICTELLRRRINRVPRVPSWRHRCMDPWGVAASRWMPESSLVAALAGCVAGWRLVEGAGGRPRARMGGRPRERAVKLKRACVPA